MTPLPRPLLTPLLALVWAMLWGDYSSGTLAFGLALGLILPLCLPRPTLRNKPRARLNFLFRLVKISEFTVIVAWDILTSSVIVAIAILLRRNASLAPCFVTVPLALTRPQAITLLAATITLTPGTLTADLAADGRSLLIHCLDAPDPAAVRDQIKSRYETRIMEFME